MKISNRKKTQESSNQNNQKKRDSQQTIEYQFEEKEITIKDLSYDEKAKIGKLINKVAQLTDEKTELQNKYDEMQLKYEKKIKNLIDENQGLLLKQQELENKFKQHIEHLKQYQQPIQEAKKIISHEIAEKDKQPIDLKKQQKKTEDNNESFNDDIIITMQQFLHQLNKEHRSLFGENIQQKLDQDARNKQSDIKNNNIFKSQQKPVVIQQQSNQQNDIIEKKEKFLSQKIEKYSIEKQNNIKQKEPKFVTVSQSQQADQKNANDFSTVGAQIGETEQLLQKIQENFSSINKIKKQADFSDDEELNVQNQKIIANKSTKIHEDRTQKNQIKKYEDQIPQNQNSRQKQDVKLNQDIIDHNTAQQIQELPILKQKQNKIYLESEPYQLLSQEKSQEKQKKQNIIDNQTISQSSESDEVNIQQQNRIDKRLIQLKKQSMLKKQQEIKVQKQEPLKKVNQNYVDKKLNSLMINQTQSSLSIINKLNFQKESPKKQLYKQDINEYSYKDNNMQNLIQDLKSQLQDEDNLYQANSDVQYSQKLQNLTYNMNKNNNQLIESYSQKQGDVIYKKELYELIQNLELDLERTFKDVNQ